MHTEETSILSRPHGPVCIDELVHGEHVFGNENGLHYSIRLPAQGTPTDSLVPLVVFLHGASSRHESDMSAALAWALPHEIRDAEANGSIPPPSVALLTPLCPRRTEWKKPLIAAAVLSLIESVCTRLSTVVDRSRVYLTGVSMGGLGCWELGARRPDLFAALIPICGGGSPVYAPLLRHMPCWFFHSAEDNVVACADTDALVHALHATGAIDVRYTRYACCPEPAAQEWMVGHNAWSRSYAMGDLWTWLLAQHKHKM